MTVYSTNTTGANRGFDGSRLAKFWADPFGLRTGLRAYRTYTELNALSDRELADMNLSRADLPRVAMDAAFKKAA